MPFGRKAGKMLRALDKMLVEGLGAVDPGTAKNLGKFLRASGFGTAAERARDFSDAAPEKRYRAFVELRLALEAATVKLYRPPRAPEAGVGAGDAAALAAAARSFATTDEAAAALAEGVDLSGLDPDQVASLLGNDDLRDRAAAALRQHEPERVAEWVGALARKANGHARRGAYLLARNLDPAQAAELTRPSWHRPEDELAAFAFLYPRRQECRQVLAKALDPDDPAPLPGRRLALRIIARSARGGEPAAWAPLAEGDAELEALVKMSAFKCEEEDALRLRSWASSLDEPVLKATAFTQLFLEGEIDTKRFVVELPRTRDQLEALLRPLRGTGRLENLEKHWGARACPSQPLVEREALVEELVALGDLRVRGLVRRLLADPEGSLRAAVLPLAAHILGLLPTRRLADLGPLARGRFSRLSRDDLHAYERFLHPVLEAVPDVRLAGYAGYLMRRRGPDAIPGPGLRALGETMIPVWGGLLEDRDQKLALLALRELEALAADPRARARLDEREEGKDPLEVAVEKLLVPGLAAEARERLEALDRGEAVPRLLEAARTRKETREAVLDLLTDWREADVLPFLAKLMGSPLPDMVKGKPGSRQARWLDKPVTRRLRAFAAAARPVLEQALTSENWTVRHHAAVLLGELADASSSRALAAALSAEDELDGRQAMVEALGRCGGDDAVPALAPLARGGDLQLRALRALAESGSPDAKALLTELLEGAEDLGLKRELRRALDRWEQA